MENFNFLGFDENYPHFSWMEYGWGILILWDFMKTWDFLDIFGTLGLESSGNPGGLGSDACWDMALSNRLTLSQCWGNFSKESNDNPLVFFWLPIFRNWIRGRGMPFIWLGNQWVFL